MQQMFYNGHYKAHGAKVQHLLEADGIVYSWNCPLRNHDSKVLQKSGMLLMLSALYVDNDPERPVKCVTYKAYGRIAHLCPIHTDAESRLKRPQQREVCIAIDKCNRKPHSLSIFLLVLILVAIKPLVH